MPLKLTGYNLILKNRKTIYKNLLAQMYASGSSHIGSSLSCLDALILLYLKIKKPQDMFILSKGHAVPALYAVLNYQGLITKQEMKSFLGEGTKLPAHPPGHFFTKQFHIPTGSLGHGLSVCCGFAQALKLKHLKHKVYCLVSDGECNEGQFLEAAQYAGGKGLGNLVLIVDRNHLQAFGRTDDVLGNPATKKRLESFNFETFECDGHDLAKMWETFTKAILPKTAKPKAIILNTIKGHGVDFMENTLEWHYHHLDKDTYQKALISIEKKL